MACVLRCEGPTLPLSLDSPDRGLPKPLLRAQGVDPVGRALSLDQNAIARLGHGLPDELQKRLDEVLFGLGTCAKSL